MHILRSHTFLAFFTIALFTLAGQLSAVSATDYDGSFQITGAVSKPLTVTRADFLAMPPSEVNATLDCQGIVIFSGEFEGVSISYLLDLSGASSDATDLKFRASDGYEVSLSVSQALEENIIIAYSSPSQSDSPQLVLPDEPGSLWIRMIIEIEVIAGLKNDTAPPAAQNPPPSEPNQTTNPSQPTVTPTQTATPIPPTPAPTSSGASTEQPPASTPPPTETPTEVQPSTYAQPENQTDAPQGNNVVGSLQTQSPKETAPPPWNSSLAAVLLFTAFGSVVGVLALGRVRKRHQQNSVQL